MIKTKNTPTTRHKVTTTFGYALFALMTLAFLLTTVLPMGSTLQYPTVRHTNIITMIIAFAIAAILPALIAYFIGDSSTRSKKETLHHYNGVLFGFAAYWVAMLMSWIPFYELFGSQVFPFRIIVTNGIPVVLTIGVIAILAVAFAKKRKLHESVLQFLPYQLTLLVAIIGALVVPYLIFEISSTLNTIAVLLIPTTVTAIAYFVLRKQKVHKLAILSDALIAMSIGWIASSSIAGSFLSLLSWPYQVTSILSYGIGIAAVGIYLYLRTRK